MSFLKRITWKREGLIDVKSEYKNIREIQSSERTFFDQKVTWQIGTQDGTFNAKKARTWLNILGLHDGLREMHVLECGCGTGWLTTVLAKQAASVKSFDISPESVKITKLRVEKNGLHNVQVQVAVMEELPYKDESFDIIVGRFILHHLADLEQGISQVSRVLKPGGKAVFYETSASNPILMFLRRHLAGRWGFPKLGTHDEHPLTSADIGTISSTFQGKTELLYPRFRFFGKLYFQVLRNSKIAKFILEGSDNLVYRCLPFIRRYSYQVMIKLTK